MIKHKTILGIRFTYGSETDIVKKFTKQKGYLVVPAAPALVDAEKDSYFKHCLVNSSFAILDSGLLVMLNNLFQKNKINRFSGLKYLRKAFEILEPSEFEKSLWILPSESDAEATRLLLKSKKNVALKYYVAPLYPKHGPIEDICLLNQIAALSPKHIFIGLGGGTQERVGYLINKNFNNKICIYCLGAAISFLNGRQVNIPSLVDRVYLGWLWRCFSNPNLYIKRYLKAFKLLKIYIKSNYNH
jgi:N-acetylglucosaminyldiphosphoundecaprenol N-acetyl-beta-D-mannosaminyltransferase